MDEETEFSEQDDVSGQGDMPRSDIFVQDEENTETSQFEQTSPMPFFVHDDINRDEYITTADMVVGNIDRSGVFDDADKATKTYPQSPILRPQLFPPQKPRCAPTDMRLRKAQKKTKAIFSLPHRCLKHRARQPGFPKPSLLRQSRSLSKRCVTSA